MSNMILMNFVLGLAEGVRQKERRSMEERLRDQEGDIRRRMEEIRSGILNFNGTVSWDQPERLTNRIPYMSQKSSVGDPDPQELYVFGSPGSVFGSVSHKYGSGSLRHKAKILRETLISTVV